MSRTKHTGDEPWSDNYPPLRAWITDRLHSGAMHCVSQDFGPRKSYAIERYQCGRATIVVWVFDRKRGWEIFVQASASNSVPETLAAADAAIGVANAPKIGGAS